MISLQLILYIGAIGLLIIGIAGVVLSSHLFRTILALMIAEAGANLLLIIAGFRFDAVAPIVTDITSHPNWVDPVPQAMVLTAIVIGVGIQALALAVAVGVYRHYGTLDVALVKRKMAADLDRQQQLPVDYDQSQQLPAGDRPLPIPKRAGGEG